MQLFIASAANHAARRMRRCRPDQRLRAFLGILLVGVATSGAMRPARAAPANEAYCRAVGAYAGKLATLRDAGRSINEALASVAAGSSQSQREALRASAALLFARFRLMSPENAEFEFYLDCLDDEAIIATPAAIPKSSGTGR